MNTPTLAQRLLAATAAIATTFSLVWAVAAVAYPETSTPAAPVLVACR